MQKCFHLRYSCLQNPELSTRFFFYKNAELLGSLGYVLNCSDFKPKNVLKMFLIFNFNHAIFELKLAFRCYINSQWLLSGRTAQSTI